MTHPSTKTPSRRWGPRIILVLLAAVVVPLGASLLYAFSPAEYTFVPCMFHLITGLHCPGCGATRCMHALLHGDILQALAYNPLFVLVLPCLLYGCWCTAYTLWTGKIASGPALPSWTGKVVLSVLIIYWIARNIDVYPLSLLAPHQI